MSSRNPDRDPVRSSDPVVRMPATNQSLLVLAGICLLIPLVALMWVGSYAKETPRLWGIPFFFWYQFLWVFITSALTYAAHRLVLAARGPRDDTDATAGEVVGPKEPFGDGDRFNPKPGFRS